MAQDIPRTTYLPEVEEDARKERERRTVQEGTATWKRRKEELQRQKHREQREVCVVNDCYTKLEDRLRRWPLLTTTLFSFISFRVVVLDRMKINAGLRVADKPYFFPLVTAFIRKLDNKWRIYECTCERFVE